jgi:RNA polymerase sigma-70 factor (ECF subfamily)
MTVQEYNTSVNSFSDNVYRFILKSVKDKDKAKDITQDSYEKLWINRLSVDREKVKSYLFSTAYHTMIDMIRREKKFANYETVFEEPSYESENCDLQEILHSAIQKLPEDQKAVILLRDYEDYSYKEISDITKLSEAQVKTYIYRARIFLKHYIGKLENVI